MFYELWRLSDGIELKDTAYRGEKTLVLKKYRNAISGEDVMNGNNLVSINLAGIGDFIDCLGFKRSLATASNLINEN